MAQEKNFENRIKGFLKKEGCWFVKYWGGERVIELNRIYNEDCLIGMKRIPDGSVDMILCDLPYGTTACKWDTIIPFEPLWEQYERIIRDNGAIVLTASQPFTTKLIASNMNKFRYTWVWEKEQGVNFLQAKKQPLKSHEDVCVFYSRQPKYNPIFEQGKPYKSGKGTSGDVTNNVVKVQTINEGKRYPKTVLRFKRETGLHPTQKPVPLFEYLIRTYTDEGETVLDNCMGSGTTAIACINTNRNFIGFEIDKHYYDIANERIQKALAEKAVRERNTVREDDRQPPQTRSEWLDDLLSGGDE